jgi:hypothetical protein
MDGIARKAISQFPALIIAVLVLLVVGIGLLIAGGGSQVIAAAGSFLAVLELTWTGIGGALRQLAGKLEQPTVEASST